MAQSVVRNFAKPSDLRLSAAAQGRLASEDFVKVRMPLAKVPTVAVVCAAEKGEIVLDANKHKIATLPSGYAPPVVVVGGKKALRAAKAGRDAFCEAWVGRKALRKLKISADDAVGCSELSQIVQALVSKKYGKKNDPSGPWVTEVYPFEGYCVVNFKGGSFKQNFSLDPASRKCSLVGGMARVYQEWSDMPKGTTKKEMRSAGATFTDSTMSQEIAFDAPNTAGNALGSFPQYAGIPTDVHGIQYGAPRSEANAPMYKTMLNVEEALRLYLDQLKNGMWKPMRSVFAPVPDNLVDEYRTVQIAASSVKADISPMDFILWQTKQLEESPKLKNGMLASAFAYVGDREDVSTWFAPYDDFPPGMVAASVAKRISGIRGIPLAAKGKVVRRILGAEKFSLQSSKIN